MFEEWMSVEERLSRAERLTEEAERLLMHMQTPMQDTTEMRQQLSRNVRVSRRLRAEIAQKLGIEV